MGHDGDGGGERRRGRRRAERGGRRPTGRSSSCCSTRTCRTWTASRSPRKSRRRPALHGATVMMLSSSGDHADQLRCAELGIAAYLTKPVYAGDLLAAIERAIGPKPAVSATRGSAPQAGALSAGADGPARPHPAGRGQRGQPTGRLRSADPPRPSRDDRAGWPGGAGAARSRDLRSGADGPADAGHGRPRRDQWRSAGANGSPVSTSASSR